ncbi:MAG: putative bifunctional diguanylate cyclase/phosphodiesterase [Actinomycetota bacterium]
MRTPQTMNGRPDPGSEPEPGWLRRIARDLVQHLPRGGALTERVWKARHRRLRQLLVFHAIGIAVFGILRGFGAPHSVMEGSVVALAALLAGSPRLSRSIRAMVVSVGLMAASAILVHISGGLIEFHFHFFVMVALISLYQEWIPFLCAIGFVVVHHGTVGVIDPTAVYNHPSAWAHPWRWAALHGLFILAMSVVSMAAWRLNEFQALFDPLTKLPNRELFRDRVERALAGALRQRRMIGVLLFDLDGFKRVNDSLGHSAGDRLLAEVADRLRRSVRAMDVASRLGGDEFAVLVHDIRGAHDAVRVAGRIERALRDPFRLEGHEILVTASMGIGIADGSEPAQTSAEQLLREADVAMYRAKEDPDVRYRVFDPVMHAAAVNRLESEAELRRAIEREELVVHYQPIVGLSSGHVAGVEALVRWDHPQRGLIPPNDFIPLAEETGLIVPLGHFVLREACREVRDWRIGTERTPIGLSVNLSTRQLRDPMLVPEIASILRETGLEAERLILEITENATVANDPTVLEHLHALRELGVRVAIDDFGTGYSSLSYLARLPVDLLKIDRSFVQALGQGSPEGSVVRVICQLANAWGLVVVGEGIEEAEELEMLRGEGCVLGQGFFLGRPLPADKVLRQIETQIAGEAADLPVS